MVFRKVGFAAIAIIGASVAYQNLTAEKRFNPSECGWTEDSFRCVKYVDNHDGDTLTVTIPRMHDLFGYHIPVRIAHIDTAEMDSKDVCEKRSAEAAKLRVSNILSSANKINLVNVKRDKYFRILADVEVNDRTSLASILLKEGLASEYEGDAKPDVNWCLMAPNYLKK